MMPLPLRPIFFISSTTMSDFFTNLSRIIRDPQFWDPTITWGGIITIIITLSTIAIGLYQNSKNVSIQSMTNGPVHDPNRPPIPPPTRIISLHIYPIKSCRGIEIETTRLRQSGLTLDRNWMFIDKAEKKFLTIRSDPSMTLINTAINEENELEISVNDKKVSIPAFPTSEWLETNTNLETVEIWDKQTDGWIYGDEINSIFSDFFQKPVALVYKGPTPRLAAINGTPTLYGRDISHRFADVVPLQIASEASIRDLNRRLDQDITIERFRPNIVIKGREDHPWEEDTWKRIRISTTFPDEEALYKIDLDVVARCARCQVPNVDPDTAEKHDFQPWEALMKFRRVDQGGAAKWKPCFGMMCIPKNEGKIAVGGILEVLETTDNHLYSERPFDEL
jgi:uncharacterized protein YcbX